MYRNIYLLLVLSICMAGCSPAKVTTANKTVLSATELHPYGRFSFNDKKELELISSGVHFGFTFQGKGCKLYASNFSESGHGYLQYVLDGVYMEGRIKVEGNNQSSVEIGSVNPGKHTLWIYKATEAQTGAIIIKEITGQGLVPLVKSISPLIEFIGNSITCGAAADASQVPCGGGEYHDQHNAYQAYGPRVARAVGAEFMLSSVSGIGIYRNWNSDGPIMPEVYEKTALTANTVLQWDFKSYDPKIVSIALGTNDFSNGDGVKPRLPFDSAKFVSNYIQFVQLVKSKYPNTIIALLSSPMIHGANRATLENCIREVKLAIDKIYPSGKPVATYFFKPMQARGCSGHPSVEDHALLAEELVPFFKKHLKN